jgi:hypothetical protein
MQKQLPYVLQCSLTTHRSATTTPKSKSTILGEFSRNMIHWLFTSYRDMMICLRQTRLKIRGNGEEISTIVSQGRESVTGSPGANGVTRSDAEPDPLGQNKQALHGQKC